MQATTTMKKSIITVIVVLAATCSGHSGLLAQSVVPIKVTSLNTGKVKNALNSLVVANNRLFFTTREVVPVGTPATTKLWCNTGGGAASSSILLAEGVGSRLAVCNNMVYFTKGDGLYATNGTSNSVDMSSYAQLIKTGI